MSMPTNAADSLLLIYLKCALSFVFFQSFASSNVCNAPQRR